MGMKAAEKERRVRKRARRRVAVRYGVGEALHLGYTSDVGERGLFLQGNTLYPPDTWLQITLDLPDGIRILRGRVAWIKQVPPAFRRTLRGGMGIELYEE